MIQKINSIELFAGCGGLACGLDKAGFNHILLNEKDKDCCNTLEINKPLWNIQNKSIQEFDFSPHKNKTDFVSGGFPCQAFSHSGKRLGLSDTRGTLFYDFARCLEETKPICFLAENVKGLLTHDGGNTLNIIIDVFSDLGYHLYKPLLLNANNYDVAQKRERVFIFGVQKQYSQNFSFDNIKKGKSPTLNDIFYPGTYYQTAITDTQSPCAKYSDLKIDYFKKIPQGGNWKNLSIEEQKKYLGKMFDSGGGKTGILKRLSMISPSVTLLTSPTQKQTERCHPFENRPLNIREYARIQSFPDEWKFYGSTSSQYRQIGNAVPVNLAYHVGKHIYNQLIKL